MSIILALLQSAFALVSTIVGMGRMSSHSCFNNRHKCVQRRRMQASQYVPSLTLVPVSTVAAYMLAPTAHIVRTSRSMLRQVLLLQASFGAYDADVALIVAHHSCSCMDRVFNGTAATTTEPLNFASKGVNLL